MQKNNNRETIEQLTAKMCKCSTPTAKSGLSLLNVTEALNAGLGIRKRDWNDGFFVYYKDGVLFGGNLNDTCRDDKPYTQTLGIEADPTRYEIVDRSYILRRHLIKKVTELDNLTDSSLIERLAKAAKVDVSTYACS